MMYFDFFIQSDVFPAEEDWGLTFKPGTLQIIDISPNMEIPAYFKGWHIVKFNSENVSTKTKLDVCK